MKKLVVLIFALVAFSTTVSMKVDNRVHDNFMRQIEAENRISRDILKDISLKFENKRRQIIIKSIIKVESGGNALAFNASEGAAGILQIRPIMVREVNRLLGYKKYSNKDRWIKEKAIQMFVDYQNAVNPEWDAELAARRWNGGHFGHFKASTMIYWFKVKANINELSKGAKISLKMNNDLLYNFKNIVCFTEN